MPVTTTEVLEQDLVSIEHHLMLLESLDSRYYVLSRKRNVFVLDGLKAPLVGEEKKVSKKKKISKGRKGSYRGPLPSRLVSFPPGHNLRNRERKIGT